jgi:hypothetical protein
LPPQSRTAKPLAEREAQNGTTAAAHAKTAAVSRPETTATVEHGDISAVTTLPRPELLEHPAKLCSAELGYWMRRNGRYCVRSIAAGCGN